MNVGEKIVNLEDIERLLTSCNIAHLCQVQYTPFTLHDILGKYSYIPFGDDMLQDTTDIHSLLSSTLQNIYVSNLKKTSSLLSSPLSHNVSLDDTTTENGRNVLLFHHHTATLDIISIFSYLRVMITNQNMSTSIQIYSK